MNSRTPHVVDQLQLRIDGRLDPAQLAAVEAHLAECPACRRAADELRQLKHSIRAMPTPEMPPDLPSRLRETLERDPVAPRRGRWVWLAPGAAAAVLLALWIWQREPLVEAVMRQAARAEAGAVSLEVTTAVPGELERHFAAQGLPVRVLDLAMMALTLEGGSIRTVNGRPIALYVYRQADGRRVVCQMFRGTLDELPTPVSSIDSGGFRFLVYRDGPRTLVVWAEGDIVCVLASSLPEQDVIALAKGKAMKPV